VSPAEVANAKSHQQKMPKMSFTCRYTLSTPSVDCASRASKSTATAVTFWLALVKVGHCPSSWLMVVIMSLPQVRALVTSTVAAYSISSADFWWCSLVSCASVATHSPVRSSRHYAVEGARCLALPLWDHWNDERCRRALRLWCSCNGFSRGHHVAPLRDGEARASSSTPCLVILADGFLENGI
jgi:hypothetical protein